MAMAKNLRTRVPQVKSKQNYPPLFSIDCLTQPSEDAFYLVNENLLKETGVSTFLASMLFKNKDTNKIKNHIKEILKGFSEEKFKNLTRTQSFLSYRRIEDDTRPMIDVLNITKGHAKLFLIDIKKSNFKLPYGVSADYLVGIHDSRKNITRILRFYNSKTAELKIMIDLKKDGIKIIE